MKLKISFLAFVLTNLVFAFQVISQDLNEAELNKNLGEYKLTVENVNRYAASVDALVAEAKKNPKIAEALNKEPTKNTITLDEMGKELESIPSFKDILQKNSLSSRDFILIPIAYMQAAILTQAPPEVIADMQKNMQGRFYMPNVELVKKNPEITPKIEKAVQGLSDMSPRK
jgi:hypothetical protein